MTIEWARVSQADPAEAHTRQGRLRERALQQATAGNSLRMERARMGQRQEDWP